MKHLNPIQPQPMPTNNPIQKLSDDELAFIAGGRSKEDDEPITD